MQGFGIARNFDVHHQTERSDVDPARSNVGRHANPRTLVAQRLQCMVALALAVLTRQRHSGKTALNQASVQMPDIVARRAEQDRGFGLVEAQQVDHCVFDIGRGNGDRLIDDIAVALIVTNGRNPQGIALITLGQRDNRLGHGRREEQRAAFAGCRVEDFFKIIAKAHVEHFVGFIEHGKAQR